jgi:hypothetical protein
MTGEKNPPVSALRYNTSKIPLSLVPVTLGLYVAAVMDFGAKKYAAHNWRKGFKYTSILDSLRRHLVAFEAGEDYDPESKLHHLAHLACNVAFLIEHVEQGYGEDDRYPIPNKNPVRLCAPDVARGAGTGTTSPG